MKKLLIILSFINFAHAKTYEINNQHSVLTFEVDYMVVSKVKGSFEKFRGNFEFSEKENKISNLIVSIDVNSLNTHNKIRDQHLSRKKFFDVLKYPKITFKAKKVIYKNSKPVRIDGVINYKQNEFKHSFKIDYKGLIKDAWPSDRKSLFLVATSVLSRKKIGLNWNKQLDSGNYVVGDLVRIEIVIEANSIDKKHPASRFFHPQQS